MASIIFVLNKEKTKINCFNEDYIEDICKQFTRKNNIKDEEIIYLYKGKKLNPKIKFNKQIKKEDLPKNEMIVFCIKITKSKQNLNLKDNINNEEERFHSKIELKSKEILCPECGESCRIKIDDFKIKLYDCQNGHLKDNVDLEQFDETQKIAKSKIKCNICNNTQENNNNKFYKCLTCNINICQLCNANHNKEHCIIEYSKQFYICNIHNQKYVSYCNKCKLNLCSICESEHKNENDIIYYRNMKPNINDTEDEIFQLKIIQLNNKITETIGILNKIMDKIKIYYRIYYNNAFNYDLQNINYFVLNNINEISNYNEK